MEWVVEAWQGMSGKWEMHPYFKTEPGGGFQQSMIGPEKGIMEVSLHYSWIVCDGRGRRLVCSGVDEVNCLQLRRSSLSSEGNKNRNEFFGWAKLFGSSAGRRSPITNCSK